MLTKCKECGGDVSDKATICPHCGFQFRGGIIYSFFSSIVERVAQKRQERFEQELECRYKNKQVVFNRLHNYNGVLELLNGDNAETSDYCKMLPWMRLFARRYRVDNIKLLFVAFCMGDEETIETIVHRDKVLAYDLAAKFLSDFCVPCDDEKVMKFTERFISFSKEANNEYSKSVDWSRIVIPHDMKSIAWYEARGVKIVLGSRGGRPKSPNHLSHIFGTNQTLFFYSSALSDAVEEDDIDEIKYLLRYGADPNVVLSRLVDYDYNPPMDKTKAKSDADILVLVKSRMAFRLLRDSGVKCSDKTAEKWLDLRS